MATLPVQIHYELREFHGDYDLVRLNQERKILGIAAEIHDQDIVDRIAEALDAPIIREGSTGTLPA